MTPRLVFLLLLIACSVAVVYTAASSSMFLGLGAVGWLGVVVGGILIDMVLRQEWPAYTARKAGA